MNRIFFHFFLIIGCLLVFPVKAQKMYQWEIYPSYHNSQKNESGKEKVYSICNNSLISYQPDYQELYLYDKTNLLNEFQISFIKYNEEVKKLVIVYSDGNIDILRDDETVINLPQYKDKNINNKDIYAVNVSGKYAFLSHLDSDHSMGILELLNDMPVEGVYVSAMEAVDVQMQEQLQEIVEKNQISLYTMKHGDMIRSEAFGEMKCLFPIYVNQTAESENERSLVLRYVYGDTSVLFTGDLEAKQESLLERNNLIEETDILKVSHHGSKTASAEAFLQALSPETAVISCGANNLYGHPHQEVLERLSACGAEILRTDEMGSVVVNIPPEGTAEVTTAAERKPIYERIKEAMEGTSIP